MRSTVMLLALVAISATGCTDEENTIATFPGGQVTVTESGGTQKWEYETAYGTVRGEANGSDEWKLETPAGSFSGRHEGTKTTIVSEEGVTTLESAPDVSELGVELPSGVSTGGKKDWIGKISTPAGSRTMATLSTKATPEEIVAFYDERYDLGTKAVINDSAMISARLADGRFLNVSLGTPKPDGRRDLVVMVTELPR